MTTASELIGRWDIVRWEQAFDDGRVTYPLGEELCGFIRYDDDGDMACIIMKADRRPFETGGQWDASIEEKAGAYDSMLAYTGRYSVDGDHVIHHVECSIYPNWNGGEQRRHLTFGPNGTLALEGRFEEGTAQARTARLVWRRHRSEDVGHAG